MSNKKIILIAVLCVILGAAAAVLWMQPGPVKIDITPADSEGPPDESAPQIVIRKISEEVPAYLIDVEYPELQGLARTNVQVAVNNRIKDEISAVAANFRNQNSSNVAPENPAFRSTLETDYEIAMLNDKFFSALITYSDYTSGAAHPNNYLMTLNYDLRSGVPVSLSRLLQDLDPESGYFERLSGHVIQDLTRQLGEDPVTLEAIRFGAAPSPENYRNFTMDNEGLTIFFDPYQVAPYAAGAPRVKISYGTLIRDILRSQDDPSPWWTS